MDEEYARQYRMLYEQHWWWRARERLILTTLTRCRPTAGSVLDVGCGDGLFFERLSRFGPVDGVEPDTSLLTPDGPHRDRIHVGSFDRGFRPNHRYAIIVMLDVLEHLDDPIDALAHALDLLAPEGLLLITVPAFRALWTTHDDLNHHRTRYTKSTFLEIADAAGMRVDQCRYFFHLLFPIKLLVRMKEAITRPAPAPPTVPAAAVNRICGILTHAEQRLFDRLALPFGSSLLRSGGNAATGLPGRC